MVIGECWQVHLARFVGFQKASSTDMENISKMAEVVEKIFCLAIFN
tara:strand:+ start:149 stop:286 length:138 start_codon:yes stop_codon:yes gene_type:complete